MKLTIKQLAPFQLRETAMAAIAVLYRPDEIKELAPQTVLEHNRIEGKKLKRTERAQRKAVKKHYDLETYDEESYMSVAVAEVLK